MSIQRYSSRRRVLQTGIAGAAGMASIGLVGCGDDDDNGGSSNGSATNTPGSGGGETPGAAASPSPAAGTPKRGGTLRLAGGPLQANLDVHSVVGNNMWHYISNFLVRYTRDGELEGDAAATLPEVTDGGTKLIFKLRPEIKWQNKAPVNGRALDSEDVKKSFERIQDPATASPRKANYDLVTSIDTPDAQTVVFNLSRPSAGLLAAMADQYDSLVSKEFFGKTITTAEEVVGTGPYELTAYAVGKGYSLKRRSDDFWRPNAAWLDGVEYTDIGAEGGPVVNALRSGQIDVGAITPDELKAFQSNSDFEVVTIVSNTREVVQMNHTKAPFDDPRVRKAVFLAFNRQRIFDNVFGGLGAVGGPFTPAATFWALPESELVTLPGFTPNRDADIAEAKKLLEAAGLGDGYKGVIRTVSRAQVNEVNDLVVPALKAIGFDLSVDDVGTDFGPLIAFESAGDFNIATSTKQSGIDPDLQLLLYHRTGGSRNYCLFSDAEIDALLDKQSGEFDIEARKELVYDIQRRLIADPGPGWLGSRGSAVARRKAVMAYHTPNWADSYHNAEEAWLDV